VKFVSLLLHILLDDGKIYYCSYVALVAWILDIYTQVIRSFKF